MLKRLFWGLGALMVIGFLSSQFSTRPPSPPTSSAPVQITDPDILRQQNEAFDREHFDATPQKEKVNVLKAKLLRVCSRIDPSYNHIEVVQMRGGLFCRHDFYNQYSLSAGALAPALSAFADEWKTQLVAMKIKRIGVYGAGEYPTGSWYDVK
jgi:hypothetical protein